MMHNYSRQIVGVASSVDRVTWACAAVWFDVQNLVKGHMDADFLPVVPPRPSAIQQAIVSVATLHKPRLTKKIKVEHPKFTTQTEKTRSKLQEILKFLWEISKSLVWKYIYIYIYQPLQKLAWSVWGAAGEPEVNGRSEAAYMLLTELRVCGMISVFFLKPWNKEITGYWCEALFPLHKWRFLAKSQALRKCCVALSKLPA